ncbi:hypothetical protein P3T36_007831 [Kitasatospora sp. MAP12-15]|uniref:hypothetical protein n=1 Tax=unclassified Kitasatospora TaxID=2633591 RepID=UPI0024761706|nr:hypothetical protein [Kitasatospora sp. MAP12-44]MDH6115624.1 hypothetical protein [Kitasatospora sp. MAP12-44]
MRPTQVRSELTAVHDLAHAREEQRLRRALAWRDRAGEDYQRARPHSPHAAADPAAAADAHAEQARMRTEAARQAWQAAEAVSARINAERRLRRLLPDRPQAHDDHDGDLPDWITPTAALRDPLTPHDWRRHLTERRDIIDRHLAARGALLATDPPAWASPLGPVPPPQAGHRPRGRWERTAALTDAWRTLNQVPADTPGPGPRPETDPRAAAWDALTARIRALHHQSLTLHQLRHLRHRPPPSDLTRQALDQLAQLRLLRAAPPVLAPPRPTPDTKPATAPAPAAVVPALAPQAERLAQNALAATLAGQPAPQAWVEQIPAPDEDDTAQQHLYRRLVAALAHWRLRQSVTGTDPLGPPPEQDHTAEWQHLSKALDLYRRARVDDRLQLLRIRREADRERLEAAAQQAAATATRTPPGAPSHPAPGTKPSHPRRPGPRRRR